MTAVGVRIDTCSSLGELSEALAAIGHYVGMEQTEEGTEHFARNMELERVHVAREGERIVAGAGVFSFATTAPGGAEVPTAGLTIVGVQPTHRRRGILSGLMQAHFDDAHERGEPLALLWASEATIYGRFGYGVASLSGDISLVRERNAFAAPLAPRGTARIVELEEALELIPPIYDRVRRERPGMLTRGRDWWEFRRLDDNPEWRRGGGPMQRVVLELDGEPHAYAIYRMHAAFESFVNTGSLRTIEVIGDTPEATAEIWRFLFDFDWISKVEASFLPLDHPLFLLLAEPRRLGYRAQDALWCRLVDVGAALSARAYASDEPVVLEVADEHCPWNTARWRVEAGRAEQTDELPDLRLEVAALGSAYLGGFTFRQLAEALRAEELKKGALARADRVFGRHPLPWCPEVF
jgi:predicted acetyltransferase